MKNLIFSIIILLAASSAYSNGPRHNFLSEPKKLSDITDLSDINCDLCGCYMGLDPNFAMNQVGVRYSLIKFFTEVHTTESDPNTDHEGHPGTSSTEYYNDVELYLRYYFTPKFRVLFSIPFSFNEIDNKRLNGMGDMKFLAQYQVYNSDITGMTNFWQRLFLGGGANLPTGVYNKTLTFGVVEPHFQPGTGSFDLLLTALHLAKLEKTGIGWRNDIVYTVNGENNNGYSFGNRFNWVSTIFYEIPTSDLTFLPHAGIYYENAQQDKSNGNLAPGTGGNVLFGTGGLDIYYGDFSLDMNFQLPVSEKLIGEQPQNDFRIYTGLGYAF